MRKHLVAAAAVALLSGCGMPPETVSATDAYFACNAANARKLASLPDDPYSIALMARAQCASEELAISQSSMLHDARIMRDVARRKAIDLNLSVIASRRTAR